MSDGGYQQSLDAGRGCPLSEHGGREHQPRNDDFGGQAATRAAYCLILSPPFCAGAMLTGPDECAINEDLFGIRGTIRSHLTVAHPIELTLIPIFSLK
jgi:hypothetical protein